jgi:hypothetical protein
MQFGRPILEVDVPDEEESVIRVTEGRQVLRVRTERETAYTECVLCQNR